MLFRSGTDPSAVGPLTFEAFVASAPAWRDGVQDYFLVIRSPSNLALVATTAGFVVAGAPGLPSTSGGAESAGSAGPGVSTIDAAPPPAAPDPGNPLGLAARAVPPEGLLPDDVGAAAWLRDAREGDGGAFVLWVSPTAAEAKAPCLVPLFVRFNPPSESDPAFGPPENHRSSARFHPADGSSPLDVPTNGSGTGGWDGVGSDVATGGFLVVHTDSNFEITLGVVLSVLVQMPASWLSDDGAPGVTEIGRAHV